MKTKTKLFVSLSIAIVGTIGLSTLIAGNTSYHGFIVDGEDTPYSLTLNSSNAYNGSATINQTVDSGASTVAFSYSNCSTSSGYHAQINTGGYIVNKEQFTSLTKFKATFTGTLLCQTSYDGKTWNDGFNLTSNVAVSFSSKPYYLKLTAKAQSKLTSANYYYSCVPNGDIPEPTQDYNYTKVTSELTDFSGQYLIVCEGSSLAFDGSLTSLGDTDNNTSVTISSNNIKATTQVDSYSFTINKSGSNYTIKSASGYYIGATSNSNSLNSDKTTVYTNTISYNSTNKCIDIKGSGGAFLRYNNASDQNRFRYFKSSTYTAQQPVQLYKRTSSSGPMPVPSDEVDFTATDNKTNYYTTDVYNTSNKLMVKTVCSDGTSSEISSSQYSYVVHKDSATGTVINSANAFGSTGNYVVVVSYKSYTPKQINITVTNKPVSDPTYDLVTDSSSLAVGDKLVLAYKAEKFTATDIESAIMGRVTSTFNSDSSSITSLGAGTVELTLGGSTGNWTLSNSNGELLGATAVKKLAWDSGTTTWSISIASNGDATIQNGTSSYGRFLYNTSSPRFTTYTSDVSDTMALPQLYRLTSSEPIYATSISLSGANSVGVSKQTTLTVSYNPSSTNQKDVIWETSNASIATVNKGVVTGVSTGTARITAKVLKADSSYATAYKDITVTEAAKDDYTILIYMCGADLESRNYLATGDITEILTNSCPSGVNIVIETGGAKTWSKEYGINANYLERYHVEGKSLVRKQQLSKQSMGESSTLQSFIEWGLSEYPADQTGLIMWNHGGGISGVCFDENAGNDSLITSEVATAVSNAFTTLGRTEKMTWIGYDACLMGVADIASVNADYFDYMVCSQEYEAGYGWDYDGWLPTLYSNTKVAPTTLLPVICDSFITDNGGTSKSNNQTLSVLDLSKMGSFVTAFNNFASGITPSNYSKIVTAHNSSLRFDMEDEYKEYMDGIADFASFLTNINGKVGSSTTALSTALNNLVIYDKYGGYYTTSTGKPCGLNIFTAQGSDHYYVAASEDDYSVDDTKFTAWRNILLNIWDSPS